MEYLKYGDMLIAYELRPNTNSKRIKITVDKDKVKVSFPWGMDIRKVKNFVESKKEWIAQTIEASKIQQSQIPIKEYVAGEEYSFRGSNYILRTNTFEGVKPYLELDRNTIRIYFPKRTPKEEWSVIIKEEMTRWYIEQAHQIFREKIEHYSKMMGLKYNQLRLKNQKTRWGSCSTRGNINLNWRVIMAPNEVIDYLIIHELAHLKYMNHSKDFWSLVEKYLPDYTKRRLWLKENGKLLII